MIHTRALLDSQMWKAALFLDAVRAFVLSPQQNAFQSFPDYNQCVCMVVGDVGF